MLPRLPGMVVPLIIDRLSYQNSLAQIQKFHSTDLPVVPANLRKLNRFYHYFHLNLSIFGGTAGTLLEFPFVFSAGFIMSNPLRHRLLEPPNISQQGSWIVK